MNMMKNFLTIGNGEKGLYISIRMIFKIPSLLVAPILDVYVYFAFMQSIHVIKLMKFNDPKFFSFTSLLTLYSEICPNLRCHNIEEFSLILSLLLVKEEFIKNDCSIKG